MRTKVKKWGNSLAVRIPSSFAAEVGLFNETEVEVTMDEGKVCVTPITSAEVELEKLLKGVTEENLHHEIDWGAPVGKEVW